MNNRSAKLVLEDGSSYEGFSFGYESSSSGEVVFSTGMVGYVESLTDPSFKGQILVMTYPLIGNYGVPDKLIFKGILKDFESDSIQVSGLIISEYSEEHNHWASNKSLSEWLIENKIPAIFGVDTRKLTKKLREKGTMLGKLVIDKDLDFVDSNNFNLVSEVATSNIKEFGEGKYEIVIVDCGIKNSILRKFLSFSDLRLRIVPWDFDFSKLNYDGLFISNGPGDPKKCEVTVKNLIKAMKIGRPIFGICLGHQLLSLAAGGSTYKLKYGHRGQNQPCKDLLSGRCFVTSQNHGFAIDFCTLSNEWNEFFVNINDKTNEGIIHKSKPFFSVQFHPEGNCGPFDTDFLFKKFIDYVKNDK